MNELKTARRATGKRTATELVTFLVAGCLMATLIVAGMGSCSSAPTPFVIQGPGQAGNEPPALNILQPSADQTVSQGQRFIISWTDSDRDSNASISYFLVGTTSEAIVSLVQGLDENDSSGPDTVSVGTSLVPVGLYNLRGVIRDDQTTVETFAQTTGTLTPRNIVINIAPPGQGPPTQPPTITVTQPSFNLSVTQDDTVRVSVQPTAQPPMDTLPYDPDSDMVLFIVLDLDQDPNNDDPTNEDPTTAEDGIIVLRRQVVAQGTSAAQEFNIPVDLAQVPPRSDGEPYFIRATVSDSRNPAVHRYASGRISVVELAAGIVDLADIGRKKAGAKFYGFSPSANTGSTMSGIGDFDNDGIADFVLVARFGNPRNYGLIGEAYLIYGLDRVRFGGAIPVNSVSETVSGVIFEGPPVRTRVGIPGEEFSEGITSVSFIQDVTGDGRPDLLFGLARVFGAADTMDYDPGDEDPETDATEDVILTVIQGLATTQIGDGLVFAQPYSGTQDLTISSATPTTPAGSSPDLFWRNDPAANTVEWSLIKFTDLRDLIPDIDQLELIDIASVQATLQFRVFETGGNANVHLCNTNFTEQTTFSTFGDGGPPVAVTDYAADALGNIDAQASATVSVDITPLIVDLINGVISEPRLIVVPDPAEGANRAGVRSSESGSLTLRPTLEIQYTRSNIFGAQGCYPDPWANNKTDQDDGGADVQFFSGGMAVLFSSHNRDSEFRAAEVPQPRLDTTVISIELVGQEGLWRWDDGGIAEGAGNIVVRADNSTAADIGTDQSEEGRIAGARFTSGWYDYYDHLFLNQGPREDLFGQTVSSIGDLNNDGFDEIIISAPRAEKYLADLQASFGRQSTQLQSTGFRGSIAVIPGANYNNVWREKADSENSTASIPVMDQYRFPPAGGFGMCSQGVPRKGPLDDGTPVDSFEIYAENPEDFLGGATSAGDFNQDGLSDILCGAPLNDHAGRTDTGTVYILYGRNVLGAYRLANADDPALRPPMLRIRGVLPGDQIGWKQATGLDVNGDRLDDVFISSPTADFGGIVRSACGLDFNNDGAVDSDDFSTASFNACRDRFSREDLFTDDACQDFDYDNDLDIDDADRTVLECLQDGGTNCCANLVDNGFVGIIFGGVFTDGDRNITQIAGSDLPGTRFFGSSPGHRAGIDISSAGDFNQDGFGDLLIAVPGEIRVDSAGRQRLGVVHVIFGGTHLENRTFNLAEVGTSDLPGITFISPYVTGRPNEAAPMSVAFLGDVNNDGFGDIAIGNQLADFIDPRFPQGPDAPGGDAEVGRRRNAGDMYLIYGNNFGSNRGSP